MEESAVKQIMGDIKDFSHGLNYYGKVNDKPQQLKEIFQEEIAKYVKEHADEVIAEAIKEVAKNMMKTKKVKESLAEV